MKTNTPSELRPTTRRDFLRTSAALAGTVALGQLAMERSAHAAGSDVIRIGLIGCGGRGTEAAANAMNAGQDIRLVALADIFDERLQACRDQLKKAKPDQVEVKDDHCFVGFDAGEKLLASGVDAVLIAAASHFHPRHAQGGRRCRQTRLLREASRHRYPGPEDFDGGRRGGEAKGAQPGIRTLLALRSGSA